MNGLAGNTTPTDPRSQRIRASRKGRPCNELGLCPGVCAHGPRVPDGLTITRFPEEAADTRGAEIILPDNGIVERFHKTALDEFYRITFRYGSIAELQTDLDSWVQSYNEERPHQGRWCFGKTPMQTFLDATPLAKEKMIAA